MGAACIVSSHSGSKMPSHRLLRQRCQSSILGVCDRAGAQQVPFVKLQTAATADKVFSNRKRRFLPGSFLFLPPPLVLPPCSAVCLRLAFLVMLHTLCRLLRVFEGFVVVNPDQLQVHDVCVFYFSPSAHTYTHYIYIYLYIYNIPLQNILHLF